jgi:hypothetical protein
MQSKLAKAIRTQFAKELKKRFPMFDLDMGAELPSGWRAYRFDASASFTAFVVLCFSPRDDRFTLEVAWSQVGRLPPAGASPPNAPPKHGGLSCRLSALWHPQEHDYWWLLGRERTMEEMLNFVPDQPAEQKIPDVAPKVGEAIEKLITFGIPYLEATARRMGLDLRLSGGSQTTLGC